MNPFESNPYQSPWPPPFFEKFWAPQRCCSRSASKSWTKIQKSKVLCRAKTSGTLPDHPPKQNEESKWLVGTVEMDVSWCFKEAKKHRKKVHKALCMLRFIEKPGSKASSSETMVDLGPGSSKPTSTSQRSKGFKGKKDKVYELPRKKKWLRIPTVSKKTLRSFKVGMASWLLFCRLFSHCWVPQAENSSCPAISNLGIFSNKIIQNLDDETTSESI